MNAQIHSKNPPHPVVREHAISDDERRIEQAVLAGIRTHFASFAGSMRESYDALAEKTPFASGIAFEAVDSGAVQGWWARPERAPTDRAILFVHGGAYALGSARAYRGFVSQIAARAGVAVFSLDYPLAPEHPFPAAHDAAVAARRWLATQGVAQLALMGDSAGGALVLSTLQHEDAGTPPVASVVVFSPWVDLALTGATFTGGATPDPIFQPAVLAGAAKGYLAGANARDPRGSPLYGITHALPPLAIQVGTDELLLDDSRRLAERAAQAGGEVSLDVFDGLHHVFQRSVELAGARRALDDAAAFVRRHWRG